jgi:hypothetical protein
VNAGNDLTKALEKFLSERDDFYEARGYRVGGKPPRFHTPLPMLKAGSYAVSSFFVVSQFNIWECPTELWLVDAQECIRINYYDEAPELHSWQGPFCHPMKVLQLFELSGSVFANYLTNVRSPEVEEYTMLFVETTPPEIMSHCRKYSEHFLDWLFHEQSYEELNKKVERNYFYK